MKEYLWLLLIGWIAVPVQAQTTALPEPQLGRLFTTPEKRLSLDRQRNRSSLENETPESETVELNGVVQRSSGHNSVWINRHMQYGADRQSGVSIKSGRPGAADIEMGKNSVQLRVGDTVNRSTQERKGLVPPNAVRNGKTP